MVELNTLLGLPKDFDTATLALEQHYKISKDRERAFPLHIAILMVDSDWNFYGYAVAHSLIVEDQKTQIEFEVLTLFTPDQKNLYKEKFIEAARKTGEVA
ncbi:MAG: DUF2584 family protein [bacterium]|nr:DUF2584 family protein [bacterium]